MTWINFTQNKEDTKIAKFPITEVGNSNTIILEAHNPTDEEIVLVPNKMDDPDIILEQYPQKLAGGQTGQIVLRFNVPQDRRRPLRTGLLFKEIMG